MDVLPLLIVAILVASSAAQNEDLHLTILHTSDFVAAFEQYDIEGELCSEDEDAKGECLGGIPRFGTVINDVRNERNDINVLLLDGGDLFLGEWFNAYKGEATSYFMNKLGYDVMTLGNLEFADGPETLASFLESINFDAVSANLNATNEPSLQGLYSKSVIKDFDGRKVGIVGYGVQRTNTIANTGGAYFEDVLEAVQQEVDSLTAQDIDIIIVLGHSYSYIEDGNEAVEIAKNIGDVDIVIVGGALSFQYPNNGCPYVFEDEIGAYRSEPYPKLVTLNDDPEVQVPVVNGYINGRYIGRMNLVFDEEGNISELYGNPIRLDKNVEQDPALLEEVEQYRQGIEDVLNRLLGRSLVKLRGNVPGDNACRRDECNLGNLITDAMVWKYVKEYDDNVWNNVSIAVKNAGAIRGTIEKGPVRLKQISNVLPFGGTFDCVDLYGRHMKEMLEHAVANYENYHGQFLQMSGMKVTYDLSGEPGVDRVRDVQVLCTDCKIPTFLPLDEDKLYRIIVPSFIEDGGDGFDVIKENAVKYVKGHDTQQDVMAKYIERFSPIYTGIQHRINFMQVQSPPPELSTAAASVETSSATALDVPITSTSIDGGSD